MAALSKLVQEQPNVLRLADAMPTQAATAPTTVGVAPVAPVLQQPQSETMSAIVTELEMGVVGVGEDDEELVQIQVMEYEEE